ncbi:hypothetical protein ACFV3R_00470 [Streptomyces sp. NPDC059740]|uniref:hypothetical protein n=1 Tax=Streptomyces sp. NPDC059740 TaxID=3346926 RepID=UPI0036600935
MSESSTSYNTGSGDGSGYTETVPGYGGGATSGAPVYTAVPGQPAYVEQVPPGEVTNGYETGNYGLAPGSYNGYAPVVVPDGYGGQVPGESGYAPGSQPGYTTESAPAGYGMVPDQYATGTPSGYEMVPDQYGTGTAVGYGTDQYGGVIGAPTGYETDPYGGLTGTQTGYGTDAYGDPTGYGSGTYGTPAGYGTPTGYGTDPYGGVTGTQAGYGTDAYGNPTGYGTTSYGSPTGYGTDAYGNPTGYGTTSYGSPTGYGTTGYGSPTGYGTDAYGGTTTQGTGADTTSDSSSDTTSDSDSDSDSETVTDATTSSDSDDSDSDSDDSDDSDDDSSSDDDSDSEDNSDFDDGDGDYDNWTWKQVIAHVTGSSPSDTSVDPQSISNPQTLQDAADTFWYTGQVLQRAGDNLDQQVEALAGENGSWKGPAAQSFLSLMKTLSEQTTNLADVLTGGVTGDNNVPQQLADNATHLWEAISKLYDIDDWYAKEAQRVYDLTRDIDDEPDIVMDNGQIAVGQVPHISDYMSQDMRGVLKALASHYRVTIDAVRPASFSNPVTGGEGGLTGSTGGYGAPLQDAQLAQPAIPATFSPYGAMTPAYAGAPMPGSTATTSPYSQAFPATPGAPGSYELPEEPTVLVRGEAPGQDTDGGDSSEGQPRLLRRALAREVVPGQDADGDGTSEGQPRLLRRALAREVVPGQDADGDGTSEEQPRMLQRVLAREVSEERNADDTGTTDQGQPDFADSGQTPRLHRTAIRVVEVPANNGSAGQDVSQVQPAQSHPADDSLRSEPMAADAAHLMLPEQNLAVPAAEGVEPRLYMPAESDHAVPATQTTDDQTVPSQPAVLYRHAVAEVPQVPGQDVSQVQPAQAHPADYHLPTEMVDAEVRQVMPAEQNPAQPAVPSQPGAGDGESGGLPGF